MNQSRVETDKLPQKSQNPRNMTKISISDKNDALTKLNPQPGLPHGSHDNPSLKILLKRQLNTRQILPSDKEDKHLGGGKAPKNALSPE